MTLPGGALGGLGTVDEQGTPVPVVVDTGTPITAFDPQPGVVRDASAHVGTFQLFDAGAIERLEMFHVTLFNTPLGSIGLDAAATPISGVLGGDNVSLFAANFDYVGGPTMTLTEIVTTCTCQLGVDCRAVFPFTLQGGQQTIALGTNLYTYPATRVVLDACLEPIADPLQQNVKCCQPKKPPDEQDCEPPVPGALPPPAYQPSGVDVKVLIATGFPGFAIGAKAYDRLRGPGAAAAALASSTERLHLPDPRNDGPNGEGLPVASVSLGAAGLSALALVSHELYFGPCAELARSRRMRRTPPLGPILRPEESACLQRPDSSVLPQVQGCVSQQSNLAICDDANPMNAIASVIEVQKPVATYVVDDREPLFSSPNADVRPTNATIEAIIGTELLQRLSTTIDYPNGRLIAFCRDSECLTYPRLVQLNECGRNCQDAASIQQIQCTYSPDFTGDENMPCPPGVLLPTTTTREAAVCPPVP